MAQIIGVRFKKVGKVYYFDPCGIQVAVGQNVIVETARGVEYGEVALANRDVEDGEVVKPLKKLIRVATASDAKVVETNQKRAKEAFHICEQKIAAHHLDMKLVSVEYTFDLNKVLFYFTADGRIDFRELVKDLASVFRTRIELRQIGVRDEAKVLGGLGICGRPLCCASFLDDFQPVSINMAKQQNLSLSPTKISGTCGRLMCCLKYEQEAYEELSRVTPRVDATVQTPDGVGVVTATNLLRGNCTVRLDDAPDEARVYRCTDCQTLAGRRPARKPDKLPPAEQDTQSEHPAQESEISAAPQPQTEPNVNSVPSAQPQGAPEDKPRRVRKPQQNKPQSNADDESKPQRQPRKPQPRRRKVQGEGPNNKQPQPRKQQRKPKQNRPQSERKPQQAGEAGGFLDANRQQSNAQPQPRRRRPPRRKTTQQDK